MEAGWYELAHQQFTLAISLDSNYYMAYIGKMLSNEHMGYGGADEQIGNYNSKLLEISQKADVYLRLTYQEQLVLRALLALHGQETLQLGLRKMKDVFDKDTKTLIDTFVSVIKGYNVLELLDAWQPLASITKAKSNVYATRLLTSSLNPYRYRNRTTDIFRQAAIDAVYIYRGLEIIGAQRIAADCIDIAEYYGRWLLGYGVIETQRVFLLKNIGVTSKDLFYVQNDSIILQGLDIPYMKRSLQSVYEYERLHFYQLQVKDST